MTAVVALAGAALALLWWPDGPGARPSVPGPGDESASGPRPQIDSGDEAAARRAVLDADPQEGGGDPATRAAGVRWTVVDARSGAGLPDAELLCVSGAAVVRLIADDTGRITLGSELPDGEAALVRAPRHVARWVSLARPLPEERRVSLEPARRVRFAVRWAEPCAGAPVAGLELLAWPMRFGIRTALDEARPLRLIIDENGRAEGWLAARKLVVGVRRDGVSWASRLVHPGEEDPVELVLRCPVERTVRVLDDRNGRPLAGAMVLCDHGIAGGAAFRTAADGSVRVPLPGRTALLVRADGYAKQRVDVKGRDPEGDPVEVRLTRAVEVRGALLGFGEGARVTAWGTERQVGRPPRWEAKLESDARFRVRMRGGEPFVLFARDTAGRWAFVEQPALDPGPGPTEIEPLLAESPLSVQGRVLGPFADDGEDCTVVDLAVYRLVGPPGGPVNRIDLVKRRLASGLDGGFHSEGLPAGELELRVRSGVAVGRAGSRPFQADATGLLLGLGQAITGRVVGSTGVAAVGAVVIAVDSSRSSSGVAYTDEDGRFAIHGLAAVEHMVTVGLGAESARLPGVVGGMQDLQIRLAGR